MYGLQKGSKLKEIVVKTDEQTAFRYRVAIDRIDLQALRMEKRGLEARLQAEEPGEAELVEMGRSMHEYYMTDEARLQERLEEIEDILESPVPIGD